jgi:hypothetical protein
MRNFVPSLIPNVSRKIFRPNEMSSDDSKEGTKKGHYVERESLLIIMTLTLKNISCDTVTWETSL